MIKVQWSIDQLGYFVYKYQDTPEGRQFYKADGTTELVKTNQATKKDLHLLFVNDYEMQELIVALRDAGVKPPVDHKLEGILEATQKHLFDMRAIVYKHEGLMFEADVKQRPKS